MGSQKIHTMILYFFKTIFQSYRIKTNCSLSLTSLLRGCLRFHYIILYYGQEKVVLNNVKIRFHPISSLKNHCLIFDIQISSITFCGVILDKLYMKNEPYKILINYTKKTSNLTLCMSFSNGLSVFLSLINNKNNYKIIIKSNEFSLLNIFQIFPNLHSKNYLNHCLNTYSYESEIELAVCDMNHKMPISSLYARIYQHHTSQPSKLESIKLLFSLKSICKQRCTRYVVIDKCPKDILRAIVLAEDPRFFNHYGVDEKSILSSLNENISAKKVLRGASTITMQVARNLCLSHKKSVSRKLDETILALSFENIHGFSKKIILELYINLIEFAPSVYGIADASLFYYSKEFNHLTQIEIIVLTYIIPRPLHFYDALISRSITLKQNLSKYIRRWGIDTSGIVVEFSKPFPSIHLDS